MHVCVYVYICILIMTSIIIFTYTFYNTLLIDRVETHAFQESVESICTMCVRATRMHFTERGEQTARRAYFAKACARARPPRAHTGAQAFLEVEHLVHVPQVGNAPGPRHAALGHFGLRASAQARQRCVHPAQVPPNRSHRGAARLPRIGAAPLRAAQGRTACAPASTRAEQHARREREPPKPHSRSRLRLTRAQAARPAAGSGAIRPQALSEPTRVCNMRQSQPTFSLLGHPRLPLSTPHFYTPDEAEMRSPLKSLNHGGATRVVAGVQGGDSRAGQRKSGVTRAGASAAGDGGHV